MWSGLTADIPARFSNTTTNTGRFYSKKTMLALEKVNMTPWPRDRKTLRKFFDSHLCQKTIPGMIYGRRSEIFNSIKINPFDI